MKEQSHNFRLDRAVKRYAGALLSTLILAAGISGLLSACGTQTDRTDAGIGGGSSSIQTSAVGSAAQDPVIQVAEDWAKAVKDRDGKVQYALMTPELQKTVYDEFSGLNWSTGTSSPWVEDYTVQKTDTGAEVVFNYATSTGSAGSYRQELTFREQDGALKISGISDPVKVDAQAGNSAEADTLSFSDLIGLLGMTKEAVTAAVGETPVDVDEGGLGFDKAGIRVWFDEATHTKVAQVLIMTDAIDLNGVRVGDSFRDFKKVFGEPISDRGGDAHFPYDDIYLSVVRDISADSDRTIAVYLLQNDF